MREVYLLTKPRIVTLSSTKRVSARTQARVKNLVAVNDFFVVRTTLGDAIGCVLQADATSIFMRLFIGERFRIFRIPFAIIFDAFRFPCGLLLSKKAR
jgi:hypothetical protein